MVRPGGDRWVSWTIPVPSIDEHGSRIAYARTEHSDERAVALPRLPDRSDLGAIVHEPIEPFAPGPTIGADGVIDLHLSPSPGSLAFVAQAPAPNARGEQPWRLEHN